MAGIIFETPESRGQTIGPQSPTAELTFKVVNTLDELEVNALVQSILPPTYLGLYFQNYTLDPQEGAIWDVRAVYGPAEPKGLDPNTGLEITHEWQFDTTGATQHRTQSIQTQLKRAPAGKVAPDNQGAVGVTEDSVEGYDVTVPQFKWTETHSIKVSVAGSSAYQNTVYQLTGMVNLNAWRGNPPGTVLFEGCRGGGKYGAPWWDLAYSFAARPDRANVLIGDITVEHVGGWEWLWVRYEEKVDAAAHMRTKRPIAVYTETIYYAGDFLALGIN